MPPGYPPLDMVPSVTHSSSTHGRMYFSSWFHETGGLVLRVGKDQISVANRAFIVPTALG